MLLRDLNAIAFAGVRISHGLHHLLHQRFATHMRFSNFNLLSDTVEEVLPSTFRRVFCGNGIGNKG